MDIKHTAHSNRGWYNRGYIPHADIGGSIQHVIFRLADSLPAAALGDLARRRAGVAPVQANLLTRAWIDDALDRGHGSCVLQRQDVATIVCSCLRHFDDQRYRLHAWVVMPNHVHVVVEQVPGRSLSAIVQGWKCVSSRQIGSVLGTCGRVWQPGYYDRLVRGDADLVRVVNYVHGNPVKAGLVRSDDGWRFSSAWRGGCDYGS